MAQEEGICIANTESVIHNAEDAKFDEIVLNLQEYKATAKVSRPPQSLFCFDCFFIIFIIAPKKRAVYKFVNCRKFIAAAAII